MTARPDPAPEGPLDPTTTTMSQLTAHLVRRAQDGSVAVWGEIEERYRNRLLTLSDHLLGPHLRALHGPEDALSEVLARTWNQIGVFEPRGPGTFYAWMCLQLRRIISDWGRREGARTPAGGQKVSLDGLSDVPAPSEGAEAIDVESRDEIRRLAEALEDHRMPGIYRELLIAVDLELRDRREVREELGIDDDLLRKRLLRGRKKWADILGADPYDHL